MTGIEKRIGRQPAKSGSRGGWNVCRKADIRDTRRETGSPFGSVTVARVDKQFDTKGARSQHCRRPHGLLIAGAAFARAALRIAGIAPQPNSQLLCVQSRSEEITLGVVAAHSGEHLQR